MILGNAKKATVAMFGTFFLFIILYGFSRSTDLLFGIRIKNVEINEVPVKSGTVFEESELKITGRAKNALKLLLNGREISIDIEGNFAETVALLPGYNIMSIQAIDKFGYADEENYKLILKE